jgi:type II secretory pathway pseudopilin PulG
VVKAVTGVKMANAERTFADLPPRHRQRGYTYLLLLFAVAAMGLLTAAAAENWSTAAQRERERELLFVGNEYREALRRYYDALPNAVQRLPESLDELTNDKRFPEPRHHLRRIYPDPLTGDTDWVLLRQGGRISGVHSRVDKFPLKQGGFLPRDEGFAGAKSYRDWRFQPAVAAGGAAPGAAAPAAAVGAAPAGAAQGRPFPAVNSPNVPGNS